MVQPSPAPGAHMYWTDWSQKDGSHQVRAGHEGAGLSALAGMQNGIPT